MNDVGILGIFCGAASLSGILLAIYFLTSKKAKNGVGVMLGLLFLAVSLRIAKSVWHYVLYDYARLGVGQGFVVLSIIGPALLFYLLLSTNRQPSKIHYLHWAWLPVALAVAIIEPVSFQYLYMYGTGLVLIYTYLGLRVHQNAQYDSEQLKGFNQTILIGVFLIGCSFVYQHALSGLRHYTYGAAFASLVIYYLLYQALTKSLVISNASVSSVSDETVSRVRQAIENEKVYLRQGVTLSNFASEYEIPSYLVTKSVNQAYAKSFPETINHFRVNEVKKRLEKGDSKNLKIEGIATESGFKTPSAFYAAFKRETGVTPTQFQKGINSL